MHIDTIPDYVIAVSYFMIPVELLYFYSTRVPARHIYHIVVGGQFALFIALCGMTHLLSAVSADTALSVFKILTAIISFITALSLIVLIPLALQLPLQVASLDRKYTAERKLCMFLTSIMGSRNLSEASLMRLVLQTLHTIFPDESFDMKVHDNNSKSPRVSRPSTMLQAESLNLLHRPETRHSLRPSQMYVRLSDVHSLIVQPVLYYENQQFFDQVSLLLQMETQQSEV